jgi:hypothetical protein
MAYFMFANQTSTNPPTPEPDRPKVESISKVLDAVYKKDRTDRIAVLKELSERQFENDKAKLDWYNAEATKRRIETNTPFTDRVGEAIFGNTIAELVKQLEAGR